MGIEIPGSLRVVASVACGKDWPQADETSLRRLADAWDGVAEQFDRIGADGDKALAPALAAVTGVVNDAIAGKCGEVASTVEELAAACRQLADACDTTANDVEHAKLSIIAALALLAAEIAALTAAAFTTAGVSAAAIPAAQIATQLTVRMILWELVEKIGVDVLVDLGLSASVQAGQILDGNRDGLDWAMLGKDAVGAVVSSGASGGLSRTPAGELLSDRLEQAVGQEVADAAVGVVTGSIGGRVADAATAPLGPPPADPVPAPPSSLNMNFP